MVAKAVYMKVQEYTFYFHSSSYLGANYLSNQFLIPCHAHIFSRCTDSVTHRLRRT
jgi:hypothetical protein